MPSMITELEIVDHDIIGGRKIKVANRMIKNFHLHNVAVHLSRLMIGQIENQTNNMTAGVVPREAAALQTGWAAAKAAWTFATDHNDPPSGSHEIDYSVQVPVQEEMMLMPNIKSRMVNQHIDRLISVIVSSDAAKSNGNIDVASAADIDEQFLITEDAINLWLGNGATNSDVGQAVPVFKHVGEIRPNVSVGSGQVREPSADVSATGRPDAVDRVVGD